MRFIVIAFLLLIQVNTQDSQPDGFINISTSCIIKMENKTPCQNYDNRCNNALNEAELCMRKCFQFYKNNEVYSCIRLSCKSANKNVQQLIDFSLLCLNATKIFIAFEIFALLILFIY
ncbi:transmembrane protein, putative (macronuclear) [Tetrahymena thermophila SB210]|uniref:Transmembrane protein, putative n=1 Tax=Tetrahymena thermophila (strain SB210) TaxID=312017 RepID=Q23NF7_TETTS|nr:transmembrane protein, putative [Tetrahymena thermophila SB210]EAR98117.1 transmembrane protein, putative [Tetrahymena thermophila SB210]|eukprot:XP_001018362.1 transmembrane protein, putative [Tetrahymena thermophila SB210]